MAFDSINGILGTGWSKAAYRGEQGGDEDLVSLDQAEKKTCTASLQKIFHKSFLSCIRSSKVKIYPRL